MVSSSITLLILAAAASKLTEAFLLDTSYRHPTSLVVRGNAARFPFLVLSSKKNSWNEEHLAHGASEVHEETNEELLKSEQDAAWDAHDLSDPGMESAAEERAVMLAAEMVHYWKEKKTQDKPKQQEKWNKQHLAHSASEVHEETTEELLESEEAAAWDAHELSDPGMESAAEERAVMLAAEMVHEWKEKKTQEKPSNQEKWNEEHLAHGASEVHEETTEELLESEQAAAWDAHDLSDPGMESAAEERAVMLAAEMVHEWKEKARAAKKNK
ncbi:expressed unknown protein [Seminavis robusta]|uniref:Uncharacterized protein n=1 Tax=Seminavis robusta TaxID=568900 RepID=A0A9N8DC80_9STRA|nr:expressed unknown protein [Seminavis robusta]|eukprot:Sro54_g031690.1 n/a (271) ;mRNA; f:17154-17966